MDTLATSINDKEKRLLIALAHLVDQYLQTGNDTLDHLSMSAGERALGLLAEYGLVTNDSRHAQWTDEGRVFLALS